MNKAEDFGVWTDYYLFTGIKQGAENILSGSTSETGNFWNTTIWKLCWHTWKPHRSLFWVVAQRRYVYYWRCQTAQGLRIQEECRKVNGSVHGRTCWAVLSLDALTLEDGTDMLSWNVVNKAIYAAQQSRTAKILSGYIRIFHDTRYIKTFGVYNCCRRTEFHRVPRPTQ